MGNYSTTALHVEVVPHVMPTPWISLPPVTMTIYKVNQYSYNLTCSSVGISPVINNQNSPSGNGSFPPGALGNSYRSCSNYNTKLVTFMLPSDTLGCCTL